MSNSGEPRRSPHRLPPSYHLGAAGFLLILLVVLFVYVDPLSPRVVVMSTGPKGSYYDLLGRRYQETFARAGMDLRLAESGGCVENLRRLNDPNSGVSAAFLQGGLTSAAQSPNLSSLGTLFYEPVWFFYRGIEPGKRLDGLRGQRISIGPEGSGTRKLVLELLAQNGIGPGQFELLALPPAEATDRMLRGDISAAIMVASWESPGVKQLLASPQIELVSFDRADAYVALFPFVTRLVLPTGVGNMAANRPPVDIDLIAPKASLVVRNDLSTAIQYLFLDAATEIHSGPGLFHRPGEFPAPEQIDLPVSRAALQFYKSGLPFLRRYLPFRMAEIVRILLVLLVPVLGLTFPLFRLLPIAYAWMIRRRIFRLYEEVKMIEFEMEAEGQKDSAGILKRLDDLEWRALHMRIPFMYAQFSYNLRHHIELVRLHIRERSRSAVDPPHANEKGERL